MLSPKADEFIEAVLSHVNYSFDRKKIRVELESHLNEKIKSYVNGGKTETEAENLAIFDMGNAIEIGRELNKMHKPVIGWFIKNIKIFAVIAAVVLCIAAVFKIGYGYGKDNDVKLDTRTYVSSLYWEINSTTNLLEYVESWDDSVKSLDHSENPFSQLLFGIKTMKSLSQTAAIYIGYTEDTDRISNMANSLDLIYQCIAGGVSYNGQLLCYDFLKDGVISEKETKFLISLKDDLEAIKRSLYDSEAGRDKFDMPVNELSKIINPFINKYSISNLTGIGLGN